MNIADILEQHARERPEHVAIQKLDEKISYEQLYRRVVGMERYLRGIGVDHGDLVGVMLDHDANHIITLFALARLGAVILGIDRRILESEREKAIDGFEVRAVIAHPSAPVIPGARVIDITGIPAVPNGCFCSAGASEFDGRNPLIVVQSSGTTGKPKSIVLSHDSVRTRILRHEKSVGVGESDRLYLMLHMAYSGSRRRSMATIYLGGTVVLNTAPYAEKCVREIVDRGITWLALTPWQVSDFLKQANGSTPLFPSLKMMTVTSSRMDPNVRSRARELLCPNLVERYATNEVGLLAIASPADQEAYPDSVGRIIDDVEAQVVGEDMRPLPAGEVGRVGFRAPYFPTAYLNDPSATARAFRDGWFYPGDLAKINSEGYLFLKGRSDDVINCCGEKFYPLEVENVLMEHTAVLETAVVGRHYDDYTQVAVAFVVLGTDAMIQDLVAHCEARLDHYKVPYHIEFVANIPKNLQGKTLKRELKKNFQTKYGLTREDARWSGDTL